MLMQVTASLTWLLPSPTYDQEDVGQALNTEFVELFSL